MAPCMWARQSCRRERPRSTPLAAPDELLLRLQRLLAEPVKPEPLRWLRAQVGQAVRMVAVEEVCCLQSADKYTLVITRDAELVLRTPLKELIAQLKDGDRDDADAMSDILALAQKMGALPSRTKTMKELAETLKTLVALERQAYDLDVKQGGSEEDTLSKLMDELSKDA